MNRQKSNIMLHQIAHVRTNMNGFGFLIYLQFVCFFFVRLNASEVSSTWVDWKCTTWKCTDQVAWHENDGPSKSPGRENAIHENVWDMKLHDLKMTDQIAGLFCVHCHR